MLATYQPYYNTQDQPNWQTSEDTDLLVAEESAYKLVVYNDDNNSFDDVIGWLVQICQHERLQAAQCALIIHNNGKCTVKSGVYSQMATMCDALCIRGLSAVVED